MGIAALVEGDEGFLESLLVCEGFDGSDGLALVLAGQSVLVFDVVVPEVDGVLGDGDTAAVVEVSSLDAEFLGDLGG